MLYELQEKFLSRKPNMVCAFKVSILGFSLGYIVLFWNQMFTSMPCSLSISYFILLINYCSLSFCVRNILYDIPIYIFFLFFSLLVKFWPISLFILRINNVDTVVKSYWLIPWSAWPNMPLASVDHCSISLMPERFKLAWQVMHDGFNRNAGSHIHRFYIVKWIV